MSDKLKCDCCGVERVKTGELSISIGEKTISGIPTYSVEMITSIQGRHICEDCMDKYMYIDSVLMGVDIYRNRIKYFGDGREREAY